MSQLYDKQRIENDLEALLPWQRTAYRSFTSMIEDKENAYPCIPAVQGYKANNLRFCFAGDPRQTRSVKVMAEALKEYGTCSRDTGPYASLVVFFETSDTLLSQYQVEDYRQLFWSVLNTMTTFDEKDWPEDIPQDPDHHQWEFCFDGEPYFAFCATPSHEKRKSRHFPYFILAFQPRWVFEAINDSTKLGLQMKKAIRNRLKNYDGIPAHPDLKWYGTEDNHEWKQYFLSDEEDTPSKCPFMRLKNKLSSFGFRKT